MKLILLLFLLVSLAYASASVDFDAYVAQYKKSYANPLEQIKRKAIFDSNLAKIAEYNKWAEANGYSSRLGITSFTDLELYPLEQIKRKAIFDSNLAKIAEYNKWAEANGYSSRLGITSFTDLEYSEFIQKYTGFKSAGKNAADLPNIKSTKVLNIPKTTIPAAWDWRSQGKVNSIKNQGSCGSCWAFSITAITETGWAIKTGNLLVLSEQELVDCVIKNNACNGGDPVYAASIVLGSGLNRDSIYPYVGVKNPGCYYKINQVAAKPALGYIWNGTEGVIKTIVSQIGPVAIAIYASPLLYHFSGTGIWADPSCTNITLTSQVNHAVAIVGYGTQSGQDYWLVRNQWGTNWGDSGYFKLPYGSNYCGVMIEPIYFYF